MEIECAEEGGGGGGGVCDKKRVLALLVLCLLNSSHNLSYVNSAFFYATGHVT